MNKLEVVGRIIQWAIELSQFNIKYHPKTTIKAQALADLIIEFTILDENRALDKAER